MTTRTKWLIAAWSMAPITIWLGPDHMSLRLVGYVLSIVFAGFCFGKMDNV